MKRVAIGHLRDFQVRWLAEADKPIDGTKEEQMGRALSCFLVSLQRRGQLGEVVRKTSRDGASERRQEASKQIEKKTENSSLERVITEGVHFWGSWLME